ncbi:MAG: hypothetical protein ACHQ5A_09475 [Opitutales bacterium]
MTTSIPNFLSADSAAGSSGFSGARRNPLPGATGESNPDSSGGFAGVLGAAVTSATPPPPATVSTPAAGTVLRPFRGRLSLAPAGSARANAAPSDSMSSQVLSVTIGSQPGANTAPGGMITLADPAGALPTGDSPGVALLSSPTAPDSGAAMMPAGAGSVSGASLLPTAATTGQIPSGLAGSTGAATTLPAVSRPGSGRRLSQPGVASALPPGGSVGDAVTVPANAGAPVTGPADPNSTAPTPAPTRDQLEAAVSQLAPLWSMLTAATANQPAGGAPAGDIMVTVQLDNQPPQAFQLSLTGGGNPGQEGAPGGGQAGTGTPLGAGFPSGLIATLVGALSQSTGNPGVAVAGARTLITPSSPATAQAGIPVANPAPVALPAMSAAPLHGEVGLPNGSTLRLALQPVAGTTAPASAGAPDAIVPPENSAAGQPDLTLSANLPLDPAEKQILSVDGKQVGIAASSTGIAVAQADRSMFTPSFNRSRAASAFAEPVAVRSALVEMISAPAASATAPAPAAPGATAALAATARQAVETVLTLVDGQSARAEQGGVVNLNFKFGQDDLAVRVQMRGGEIQTQFRTDSPELRSALATEWRAVAGASASGAGALHLAEPEFVSATGGAGGFQTSTGGQAFSQQQASQQPPSPANLPELRPLRPAVPAVTAEADPAPGPGTQLPTSLHLTAVA